jgi:hypothetical protein
MVVCFFDQGCAMPTYKEAVKLAKEYALSARLAFTKQGAAEAWGIAKKYQMRLPNWILAESRTSALRHYSTQKRLALRRFSDKSPSHYVPLRPKKQKPRPVSRFLGIP